MLEKDVLKRIKWQEVMNNFAGDSKFWLVEKDQTNKDQIYILYNWFGLLNNLSKKLIKNKDYY